MNKPKTIKINKRIILFDGVCNLCSGFMLFIYRRDPGGIFKFAWLQEKQGQEILDWLELPVENFETIIFIENGQPYFKSTAFLKIVRHLRFPWPVLMIGMILPRFIRDWIYDYIAAKRYRWFGRKDNCLLPTGDLLKRFL